MTSLPISAHPRPYASRLARRVLHRAARQSDRMERRATDARNPLARGLAARASTWNLPRLSVTSAFVAAAILCLLAAALLLDTFWNRTDLLQTRTVLQGIMLSGLLGLWAQLQHLQTRQARDSQLARQDELTGLPNRRALNEQLQALASGRASGRETGQGGGRGPSNHVWSVLLIDVDHFKAVNDVHGHLAGDEVLKAVTLALRQELRGDDILGRWGGEEFLALLPATGFEGALVAAERLRRAVSLRTFPYAGSVTVSIGVASAQSGDPLERVVARADTGMYYAKRTGRNRVAFSE